MKRLNLTIEDYLILITKGGRTAFYSANLKWILIISTSHNSQESANKYLFAIQQLQQMVQMRPHTDHKPIRSKTLENSAIHCKHK